ncbi:hypothetical protein AAIR98_001743 [Elusimicrobium simillimum]|uniref:permease-like cell division protein FtsX n=1 Tax=Elusimicrobium simillimum TaxID=3143438 RepID=UPI003C6EAA16
MKESKKVAELETSLQACRVEQRVSRGYKRVFFLTLLIALLMQSFCFFYMQARQVSDVLHGDFKIILTLNSALTAQRVNEIGEALSNNGDVLSLKFLSADDAFELIKEQNPRLAENFVFLGRRPMAEYFELTVSDAVLSDIDTWIADNITAQIPDVTHYYKSSAASAAAYSSRLIKFLNLVAAMMLVVLFSFVLFVEGYSIKTVESRWGAAFIALLSYGISFGVFYQLLLPLKEVGGGFFIFTIVEIQCIIALAVALTGWVLSKWKRF